MQESIPAWVREKPLPVMPDREETSSTVKSLRRDLRYAATDDELRGVLRDIDHCLQSLEEGETDLRIRSFYLPGDHTIREALFEFGNAKLGVYAELADLLETVARSSKSRKLEPFVDKTYLYDADRLASTYAKNLLAHLLVERELIRKQMKRLQDASLSTTQWGSIKGEVRLLFQSSSRDKRARAYNSFISQLSKSREEMVGHFLELHMLRRMISEKAGYKNFYEYETRRVGQTDSFRSQVRAFRLFVQEHVSPVMIHLFRLKWERLGLEEPEPWDLMYPAEFGLPKLRKQAFPLDKASMDACQLVCEAEVPVLKDMLGRQALYLGVLPTPEDISSPVMSSHPWGTRLFSAYSRQKEQSFLMMESVPQELLAGTLFYEIGTLLFEQSNATKGLYTLPSFNRMLAKKIAGHSLVFLSQKAWNTFYGPMTLYAREYLLSEILLQLPRACALDEMEEFLAKARISDMNVFQHAWREIAGRYHLPGMPGCGPGLLSPGDVWMYAPDLWSAPLSGIADAIALVTVLGTLPLGKHHQHLENCLLRLLNNADGCEPVDRAKDAGYPSPFEEETIRKSVFTLADFLAL